MKVEYLENINYDYPDNSLIRIYDFTREESKLFSRKIMELLNSKQSIKMRGISFVEMINCDLELIVGIEDQGIIEVENKKYTCILKDETYKNMVEMIDSYNKSEKLSGYHWLYDLNINIDFLYSQNGDW